MRSTAGVHCLDDELFEYAAGRLAASRIVVWQRHLAVCDLCAVGLQREQRLRAALAGAPSMPGDLRTTLMAMGRGVAEPVSPGPRPEPLALLAPSAPPCHRSPLRATVVATAAAGVSAAAAWSLTVIGTSADLGAGPVEPAVATSAAATPTPGPTASGAAAVRWVPAGTALLVPGQQAQSTP